MEQETRRDPRAPLRVRVRYRSATVEDFLEESSVDLSASGLFVGTRDPMDVGTLVKFELVLSDDSPVVEGVGRVVWVRNPMDLATANDPPGMGLKFVKMDPDCRARVEEVVARRADEGLYERGAAASDLVPSEAPAGGFPDPASSVAPVVYEKGQPASPAPATDHGDAPSREPTAADLHPQSGGVEGLGWRSAAASPPSTEPPPTEPDKPSSKRDAASVAAAPGSSAEPPPTEPDTPSDAEAPAAAAPAAEVAAATSPAAASPPAEEVALGAAESGPPRPSAGPREPTPFPPEPSAPTWVLPVSLMLAGLVALGLALFIALG